MVNPIVAAAEVSRPIPAVIYAEGEFAGRYSKTAISLLRYGNYDILGVIDSTKAGRSVREFWPYGGDIRIFSKIDDLSKYRPEILLIGVAPRGGELPLSWIEDLNHALELGMDIYNGLHRMLGDLPVLKETAARCGRKIWDTRAHRRSYPVGMGRVRELACPVMLTIGTDCAIGKMTVALELVYALKRIGVRASFIPTGQTGMMIANYGLCVDSIKADFISGAIETLLLERYNGEDILVVEGQGGIFHPGYSTSTIGLLHGCLPEFTILCHQHGRTCFKDTEIPLPIIPRQIAIYSGLVEPYRKSRCLALAIDSRKVDDGDWPSIRQGYENENGLFCYDPLRDGCEKIGKIVEQALQTRTRR